MQRQKAIARCAKSAAHASAFLERLQRRSRRSSILVAEGDVIVDVVAESRECGRPRSATRQTDSMRCRSADPFRNSGCRGGRRAIHRGAPSTGCCCFHPAIASGSPVSFTDGVRGQPEAARGRNDTGAHVAEAVQIRRDRHERIRRHVIANDDVACTRGMGAQHQGHRRRLRADRRSARNQLGSGSSSKGNSPPESVHEFNMRLLSGQRNHNGSVHLSSTA